MNKENEDLLKAIFGQGDTSMQKGPVTSPVKYNSVNTAVNHEVAKNVTFLDDDYGQDECEQPTGICGSEEERNELLDENLAKVKFADQIKIDFIITSTILP